MSQGKILIDIWCIFNHFYILDILVSQSDKEHINLGCLMHSFSCILHKYPHRCTAHTLQLFRISHKFYILLQFLGRNHFHTFCSLYYFCMIGILELGLNKNSSFLHLHNSLEGKFYIQLYRKSHIWEIQYYITCK